MHDAIKRFDTEADARAHHANMVKLNPTRGIKHNLYVGDKPELLEHSTGNHGEYANDVAEKTMVHAIINQLFGGAKTEENYDTVYSFLESDLASDFYDKYYKTFEEDSERRKARRMGDEVKQPTPANATLMGQFRKELPELYSKWKKTK
jgi:hypothetical protein